MEIQETLSFKEVRAEAENLWVSLMEKDPDNKIHLMKKIEMVFGHPMKLSEVTEDQVDLLYLVVLDMRDMLAE